MPVVPGFTPLRRVTSHLNWRLCVSVCSSCCRKNPHRGGEICRASPPPCLLRKTGSWIHAWQHPCGLVQLPDRTRGRGSQGGIHSRCLLQGGVQGGSCPPVAGSALPVEPVTTLSAVPITCLGQLLTSAQFCLEQAAP